MKRFAIYIETPEGNILVDECNSETKAKSDKKYWEDYLGIPAEIHDRGFDYGKQVREFLQRKGNKR